MVRLESHQQALAQVEEDIDSLKKRAAPSIADYQQNRATDHYCRQVAQSMGTTNAEYIIDKNRLTIRLAPVNGAVQILVSQALREYNLYHSDHHVMAGRPG